MSPALRSCAPWLLLSALVAGHAAGVVVLAHVIRDHGVAAAHGHPHGPGHHEPAASDHAHHLLPATISAPARTACPETSFEPCRVPVRSDARIAPDAGWAASRPGPAASGDPPASQRHSVLLI